MLNNPLYRFLVSNAPLTEAATIAWAFDSMPKKVTLTANRNINITGLPTGFLQFGVLEVVHQTANTTIALPGDASAVNWNNSDAGKITLLGFYYNGSTFIWSSQVGGTAAATTPLSTPVLTGSVISDTRIDLAWGAIANATSYILERATNSGFTANLIELYPGNTTSYPNTGLTASTTYYYRLRAIGGGAYSNSANSNTYTATTAAAGNITPPAPTAGVVNDTANTFAYTLATGYTLADHEMTLDGGVSWATATNPVNVGDTNKSIGQVGVRVKAATGRNVSATLTNATAFTGTAVSDYAYKFDAPAQIISAANPSDFNFNLASSFSVGMWIKATASTVSLRMAYANSTNRVWDINVGYQNNIMVYGLTFVDGAGSNYFYKNNISTGTLNTWHYVVITYSGTGGVGGINVYVDGVLDNGDSGTVGTMGAMATATFFKIGQLYDSLQDSKDVLLDDLFVANVALSGAQVTSLYNSGTPNPASQSWYANVVAFWKFNNNLTDEKGTHNGTATTPQYVAR